MEILGIVNLPGWLVAVLTVVLSLYIYTTYKQSLFRRMGIPGPKPVPFLGDLPQLIKTGFHRIDIDGVKQYGKCYGAYIGNIPTLMVADPDMIKEISIKQFQNFTDRTQSLGIPEFWRLALNNATGDHWKFLRSTISPTFSSGKMRKMSPIIHKCLDNFVENVEDKLKESDALNMQSVFGALTMDVICATSFGIDVDSQRNPDDPFVKNASDVLNFNIGSMPLTFINFLFPEVRILTNNLQFLSADRPGIKFIKAATKKAIEERKRGETSKFTDLLQLMIDANKEMTDADVEHDDLTYEGYKTRGLTNEEILANSVFFLLAGYDTTATTLTWLSYCLAANPDCQDRLIAEIDTELCTEKPTYDSVLKLRYLDMVLSETLRLYSPASRTNRQVLRDTVVCGQKIPGGISVTFPIHGLHRLSEYWPDPERFDPERFSPENKEKMNPYTYMPFGVGPRKCVGMRLALIEVKIATVVLLQRYRLRLSEKQEVPPKIGRSLTVRPEGGMWLKLEKR